MKLMFNHRKGIIMSKITKQTEQEIIKQCKEQVKVNSSISKSVIDKLIAEYSPDISIKELCRKYNLCSASVGYHFRKKGVKIFRRYDCNRRYQFNFDFFEKIDTEEKAYWLGFIASDGHVNNEKGRKFLKICSSTKDSYHLEKLVKMIGGTQKVVFRFDKKSKDQTIAELSIYSMKISQDLFNKGMTRRKTYSLNWEAVTSCIPNNLMSHFIRGFFDGDGCIHYNKVLNNKSFNIICKSHSFLENMHKYISEKAGINHTPLVYRKSCDIHYISRGGRRVILKIYDFLYKDATVFLERKKNIFEDIKIDYSKSLNK